MIEKSELITNYDIWILSYSLSIIILIIGSIFILFSNKKQRKTIMAVVVLFISILFLQFPIHFVTKDYTLFESVLGSFLESIGFIKGKEYLPVLIDFEPHFSMIYSYTLLILQLLVFITTAGVVLSLFKSPFQVLRAYFVKGKELYVFSEYNAKTYSIAESLKNKKGVRFIFADCGDLNQGEINKIGQINGIYLKGQLVNILVKIAKRYKNRKMCIFIFSDSESENIYTLSMIQKNLINLSANKYIRIYIELIETAWDEQNVITLQNKFGNNVIVNYVRVADNFAINNLYSTSIFDNAIEKDDILNIHALIVGIDEFSYAMIKNILTLAQMPKYFLHIHVIDNSNGYDVLRKQIPELCDYMNEEGNAKYAFSYHENINPNTYSFEKLIEKECPDFTFCFVNMKDNVQNHAIVSTLNRIRYRCGVNRECIIQVKDIQKTENCEYRDCYENMQIVGEFSDLYSYENISKSLIEEITRNIHELRQKDKEKQSSWESYANNEYNRCSTYNRTLCIRYKIKIIDEFFNSDYSLLTNDEYWASYEHMRWNMHLRALGYVVGKETKKDKRVHKCLVPFEQLTEKEKSYDYIEVDEEIIKLLS